MPPSNSMRPVCVACHCVRTIADAGANARDKIPSARLCAKNAGGLCVAGGGGGGGGGGYLWDTIV